MNHRLILFHLVLLFFTASQVSTNSRSRLWNTPIRDNLDFVNIKQYRQSADKWLSTINSQMKQLTQKSTLLSWQMNTNRSIEAKRELSVFEIEESRFNAVMCQQQSQWIIQLLTQYQQRMMKRLCRGLRLNQNETRILVDVSTRLQTIYSEAVITVNGRNYSGESEAKSILAESRDYSILLEAWTKWRNAVGPPSRKLYQRRIEIENLGAKAAGYHDLSEIWKNELEVDHLEKVIDELYTQIEPFYIQLHAFVRGRLAANDSSGTVRPDRPLPAHVLGNLWSQNWEPLLPHLINYLSTEFLTKGQEASRVLSQRYSTFKDLAEVAENFFLSLGFQPLPPTFWTRSQFVQPTDGRKPACHGSATNFYNHQDVRLLMCGKINEDDFYTLHHEMGHLYYYLSYSHQPYLFQSGANSAFHEAIGDTIVYAAMATQHRKRLGFISADTNTKHQEIVNLLRQALVKIPLLPFSLALEKWRWNVMAGRIKPEHYNKAWWDLKLKYQGIVPPVTRSEKDFDPASKFHIISGTPYIRYFLSGVLQVQIFGALCDASKQGPRFGKPLNQCDIYGSIEAGNRLRAMMSLGSSQPWNVALKVLTQENNPKLDARPLMDYYRPLHEWLQLENRRLNYTIGFQ